METDDPGEETRRQGPGAGLVIDTAPPPPPPPATPDAAATTASNRAAGPGSGSGGGARTGRSSHSPFSPAISPMGTPRELLHAGPLPYGGDEDLEKAIHAAMRNKDTKAWKLLIKARTVKNNLTSAAATQVTAAKEELRPALARLGWTENEVKWAQARAEGDLVEGIRLLLKDETSAHGQEGQHDERAETAEEAAGHGAGENLEDYEDRDPSVTPAILRRLSIDSTWQLLQSTNVAAGDEAARRRAWMENALLLVQVSSLHRQGRLSGCVKGKMKSAIAQGMGGEVRRLLEVVQQQQPRHRDSVDREDSLFTSYKCPLTDDLLYEPVTLVCGHTFSKRALDGVLSCGNRKCPICRGPISVSDADELRVNILLRDTITRLFADRILQLVKKDIAALSPENIELAADELFFIIERYKGNEDIVDLAVHTLLGWTRERKNLAPLSRRGLGRELLSLLHAPTLRASAKFQRRTAAAAMQVLLALGSGSAHGAKVLSEAAAWEPALGFLLDDGQLPQPGRSKPKGPELAALAAEAFRLAALAIKANQEAAALRVEPTAMIGQVLVFLLETRDGGGGGGRGGEAQEAGAAAATAAGLQLIRDLLLLAQIKGVHHHLLVCNDALQVLSLWAAAPSAPAVIRAAATALSTAIFVQKGGDADDDVAATLVGSDAVELGLEALRAFPDNAELVMAVVPLLLRLGFSAGPEANIVHEDVCHKLKGGAFIADVGRFVEGLEAQAQAEEEPPEDPIVFEKASSSRIDIQENGTQVMANGKGWVVGSAISSGTIVLTYEVLQEDKGDECSCLGISLLADPPATAEYRSTGSPFVTLRCFSGEVYRDSRVLHASEAFKVHPGGVVRVSVDLEAGSLSFQVNDGPPVLVASDLKGRTVYPAAYFYLGEAQPDRSTHPIVRMTTSGSQITKAAVAVDAGLSFTFPPVPRAVGGAGGAGSAGAGRAGAILYQEGQLIKRRPAAAGVDGPVSPTGGSGAGAAALGTAQTGYAYAIGEGVTSGIHTYVFKAVPVLSICFGVVASDVVEPQLRLGPGPPEAARSSLLVGVWSTGRVVAGGLPQGLAPVAYDAQDFLRAEEPITVRLRLEGAEPALEVVRAAKVIFAMEHLDRCLPGGQGLHPFVALLSPDDAISVEYRVSSPLSALGAESLLDRKTWALRAQAVLQDLNLSRRSTRAPSLESPSCLSLETLFQYLEEPSGPYRPILLLEELRLRAHEPDMDDKALAEVAWNICRGVARGINWEGNVREKALQILAGLPYHHGKGLPADRSMALVRAGALALVVKSPGGLTLAGLDLFESLLGAGGGGGSGHRHVLQSYAQEQGMVPLLLAAMEAADDGEGDANNAKHRGKGKSLRDRALDALLLLIEGEGSPLPAVRAELQSLGLLHACAKKLAARCRGRNSSDSAFKALLELLAGRADHGAGLVHRLVQLGAISTSAHPFLARPTPLDEGEMADAVASVPSEVLVQRRKVTELQESWRGYVSKAGVVSTCWQDAAFLALQDGDVDMLRVLLAAPQFLPFLADRVVFAPAWRGPWAGVLSEPATLLAAQRALRAKGLGCEEATALLQAKAVAFRQQLREGLDDKAPAPQPPPPAPAAFYRHPRADGSTGTFAVAPEATAPFGFQHNDMVFSAAFPAWGFGRVLGVAQGRLWIHWQNTPGAVTSPAAGWGLHELRLMRGCRDGGSGGASTSFRLPLERGTRVVRGPHWEWGNQDSFPGNVGTVLGHGGGDGWYRVQWDTSNTSNSYQYMPEHQDIARFNDPLENPLAALFPAWALEDERQYVNEEGAASDSSSSMEGVLSATNVLPAPHEALAEAGTASLLGLLDARLWDAAPRAPADLRNQLLWVALGQLGLGSASRMATIVQHASAQAAVAAAIAHVVGGGGGDELELDGALLLLACVARTGPVAAVHARLLGEPRLLPALLEIVAKGGAQGPSALLALSILDAIAISAEGLGTLVAALREDGGALWERLVAASLDSWLDPARVYQAAAHVLMLRLLRVLLGDGALQAQRPWADVKERLVGLLEAYAGLAESAVVMEELLRLIVAWIGPDARAEASAMTTLANALLDRYDRVNDTFVRAPRAFLLAAPSLLRRAILSRPDAAARARSVDRLVRAGTLNFFFEGDYDWAGREAGHVLELWALLRVLLESGGPGREEQIVSLPLARALLPALRSAEEDTVVAGVLQILASRLPRREKLGRLLHARAGGHHGRRRRRQRLLWGVLGGDLASAVCATYRRFAHDQEAGALVLRILASVVAETGVLEQAHLDVLLADEEGGGEAGAPLSPLAGAKLRIVGAACRAFEADANVDTDALVDTVVDWLGRAGEDKAVMDAALQLLLNLVDNAHTLLPEEVLLSSGSLNTKSLFVPPTRGHPNEYRRRTPRSTGSQQRPLTPQPPPTSSPMRPRRRWHSSSEAIGPLEHVDSRDEEEEEGYEEELAEAYEAFAEEEEEDEGSDDGSDEGSDDSDDDEEEEEEEEDGGEGEEGLDESAQLQPGWEPTRTRLPHWVQFYLPHHHDSSTSSGAAGEGCAWRALEYEQRDFQNSTPRVIEVSVGRRVDGASSTSSSLPLPPASLRVLRTIAQTNHRQTGWLTLVEEGELEEGEDVVQVLVSANFGADEVSTKFARFRVLARMRTSVAQVQARLRAEPGLLGRLVAAATAHVDDRGFLRTVTVFLRRFFPPEAVRALPALANSDVHLALGQAAGITFSDDGKRATFPFGPKLLVSALDAGEGVLRWVFKSSGNSSWAVGAIPNAKVERHDVMMAEQSLAVATTGLAGGRVSLRKQIHSKRLEAVIDPHAGCFVLTAEDDRDNPITIDLPPLPGGDAYRLAIMGYSGTTITFLDEL